MNMYAIYQLSGISLIDCGAQCRSIKDLAERFLSVEEYLVIDHKELPADFSVDTYTIENGELVKASAEIIAKRDAAKQAIADAAQITRLRAYLTSTDYAAIKCGELGLSMAEIYPDLHAQRTAARARINDLEEGGAE